MKNVSKDLIVRYPALRFLSAKTTPTKAASPSELKKKPIKTLDPFNADLSITMNKSTPVIIIQRTQFANAKLHNAKAEEKSIKFSGKTVGTRGIRVDDISFFQSDAV